MRETAFLVPGRVGGSLDFSRALESPNTMGVGNFLADRRREPEDDPAPLPYRMRRDQRNARFVTT